MSVVYGKKDFLAITKAMGYSTNRSVDSVDGIISTLRNLQEEQSDQTKFF